MKWKPKPYGCGHEDWLCRSQMGMAEKADHFYPYAELLPKLRT